jgi:hypothetical protein
MPPQAIFEDDRVILWANLVRATNILVLTVHAVATSTAGEALFTESGFYYDGRPRLTWRVETDDGDLPLPHDGSAGGSERQGTWTWIARWPTGLDEFASAIKATIDIPALGLFVQLAPPKT